MGFFLLQVSKNSKPLPGGLYSPPEKDFDYA
jgi:hypothetical protein